MRDEQTLTTARPPQEMLAPDTPPDTERMMARLALLESLLREHQAFLRSRRNMLQDQLARAGLDTPQKIQTACAAITPALHQVAAPSPPVTPVGCRARSDRLMRTV